MAIVDNEDGLYVQESCEVYRYSSFGWNGVGHHSLMKDPFAPFLILNFFGYIFSVVAIMFSLSDFHGAWRAFKERLSMLWFNARPTPSN